MAGSGAGDGGVILDPGSVDLVVAAYPGSGHRQRRVTAAAGTARAGSERRPERVGTGA
jgi:hypothetical protein